MQVHDLVLDFKQGCAFFQLNQTHQAKSIEPADLVWLFSLLVSGLVRGIREAQFNLLVWLVLVDYHKKSNQPIY